LGAVAGIAVVAVMVKLLMDGPIEYKQRGGGGVRAIFAAHIKLSKEININMSNPHTLAGASFVPALGRVLLSALFLLAASAAWAAPVDVYRGALGTAEVVMELGQPQPDGTRQGRYFYRRHGVDIPLQGALDQLAEAQPLRGQLLDSLGFDPRGPLFEDAQQRRIVWHARLQGDTLAGEWEDGIHGKKLPFSLQRMAHYDPEKIAPQGVEAVTNAIVQGVGSGVSAYAAITMQTAPYDYLRIARQPLEQGKEIVLAPDLAWRPVRDARTKFWYPRLTRHPSAKILAQTNAALEQRHWAMSLNALGCMAAIYEEAGPAAGTLGGYDQESIDVTYLSHALMSVIESGSTFCGGAHPNNHFAPFVLDLLRGGYLDFSRILQGVSHTQEGWPKYSPKLVKFIHRRQAIDRQAGRDDGCSDYLLDYMTLMLEAPTSKSDSPEGELGFVISGIGHAMGDCLGSGVRVPFSKLGPVLQPKAAPYLQP
jgi:hypothetical protein